MTAQRCGHRKLRVRAVGEKFRAFCACGAEGADHDSVTEAVLAFRSDLADAEAEKKARVRRAQEVWV